MKSLPDELMDNFTKKLEDVAEEKTFREAKNFACCVSGNKVFKCKKAGEKDKRAIKSSKTQCVYDLMYDIKLNINN